MDPELVRTAVMNAVHVEDVGYRTRAQDITDEVTTAVHELAESGTARRLDRPLSTAASVREPTGSLLPTEDRILLPCIWKQDSCNYQPTHLQMQELIPTDWLDRDGQ